MNNLIKKMRKDLIDVHNKYSSNIIFLNGEEPLDIVNLFDFDYINISGMTTLVTLALRLEGIEDVYEENSKEFEQAVETLNYEIEEAIKKIGA